MRIRTACRDRSAALVLILALLVSGCRDEPAAPGAGAAPEPVAKLVTVAGCKIFMDKFSSGDPAPDESCVVWSYDGTSGTLRLSHVNGALNCCPTYTADLAVGEVELVVTETETAGDCDCLCLYDFTFEITNLPPGVYAVSVRENYLDTGDAPLVGEIDLLAAEFGRFCVPRKQYPWGI